MPARSAHACAQRAATMDLAAGKRHGDEREQAELHLLHCEACRAAFRHETHERYPKVRNYTILRELGRGGFGVVYKALHHSKERFEAVKVLFGKSTQRAAYFENEVRVVAQLRHANIATLFEARVSSPPLYYTMEYVDGQNLDDYLHYEEVSLERRIELVKIVATATGYAHRQGVVHRDLKPQNILIDKDGEPRILDFGIAKRLVFDAADTPSDKPAGDDSPPREGALGTYGYIAPEQMAGEDVDWRADIYGLGALLFHIITGQPARFATEPERLRDVLRGRDVNRADDLAAIIACCVNPLPEKRYASCEALVDDLDRYLAGHAIYARPDPTPGHQVARISALVLRNYPRAVQSAAALIVAMLLTLTFWEVGARWLSPAVSAGQAVLVGFTPDTRAAIDAGTISIPGLDPDHRPSYRVLYGALMEKLAASRCHAVVWDYYFARCQPGFDEALVSGMRRLRAPAVIGALRIDVNAEPLLCRSIKQEAAGWGLIYSTDPGLLQNDVIYPLAVQRGFNAPVPSLAVAAYAAARQPDCTVDLRPTSGGLHLRYRKRDPQPGEKKWLDIIDTLPIYDHEEIEGPHPALLPGDRVWYGRFPNRGVPEMGSTIVGIHDILEAGEQQLREWFSGRAIVVGQMLPGVDQHHLASGEPVFGAQVHAAIVDALLSEVRVHRFSRAGIAIRVCLWCLLAAILVNVVPVRTTWPRRVASTIAVGVFLVAVILAIGATLGGSTPWAMEVVIAVCAVVGAGGPTLAIRILHQRQLHLTPGPIWPAGGTTVSTTLLATTRDSKSVE